MWHAGSHRCFEGPFIFSIFGLVVAVLGPVYTYYWLWKKNPDERQHTNLIPLTGHYQDEYWYVFH